MKPVSVLVTWACLIAVVTHTAHAETGVISSVISILFQFFFQSPRIGYLENKERLAKYQDAWKAITKMPDMYLYQRSYGGGILFQKDSYCIRLHVLANDSGTETTTVDFRYVVNKKDHIEESDVGYFKVYNATEKNDTRTLYFSFVNGTDQSRNAGGQDASRGEEGPALKLRVAFTDYKTCLILRVPKASRGKAGTGCQMWVDKAHVGNVTRCCQFIYGLLCGPETYVVYNRTQCAKEDRQDVLVES